MPSRVIDPPSRVIDPPSRTAGVAAQAYCAVALGDGRVRLAWAEADAFGAGEAAGEAALVLRQASRHSAAISEAAERETAEIRRQASAQSAAIRRAAELEAAELRAVIEMPARLGGMVPGAGDLASPARPAARPERQLISQLPTLPVAGPRARPGAKAKGRQARAMRQAAVLTVALVLASAAGGTTEIARHGLPFFFFRNAGAGAGNSQNLDENQGPGQPDAPRAHRPSPAARPSSGASLPSSGASLHSRRTDGDAARCRRAARQADARRAGAVC